MVYNNDNYTMVFETFLTQIVFSRISTCEKLKTRRHTSPSPLWPGATPARWRTGPTPHVTLVRRRVTARPGGSSGGHGIGGFRSCVESRGRRGASGRRSASATLQTGSSGIVVVCAAAAAAAEALRWLAPAGGTAGAVPSRGGGCYYYRCGSVCSGDRGKAAGAQYTLIYSKRSITFYLTFTNKYIPCNITTCIIMLYTYYNMLCRL